jgi:hypothetical protein
MDHKVGMIELDTTAALSPAAVAFSVRRIQPISVLG